LPRAIFAECLTLGKAAFAKCLAVPSVLHSVNKLFIERRTLPSAALDKVFFAECPIKSTRQSRRHSAKARIPVVKDIEEGSVYLKIESGMEYLRKPGFVWSYKMIVPLKQCLYTS
jgi:hypothetical protein